MVADIIVFLGVNRLDRLTSGLMIIPTNVKLANALSLEFASGKVQKEYIARCRGEFPESAFSITWLRLILMRDYSEEKSFASNHS